MSKAVNLISWVLPQREHTTVSPLISRNTFGVMVSCIFFSSFHLNCFSANLSKYVFVQPCNWPSSECSLSRVRWDSLQQLSATLFRISPVENGWMDIFLYPLHQQGKSIDTWTCYDGRIDHHNAWIMVTTEHIWTSIEIFNISLINQDSCLWELHWKFEVKHVQAFPHLAVRRSCRTLELVRRYHAE